jgi:hypothetical protein
MRIRDALPLALVGGLLGCDGVVRARVRVVSTQGGAIPDALVSLDHASDHDLARYTDSTGCADFGGVVGPARRVKVSVSKPGFETRSLKLGIGEETCLVVHLAPDGQGRSSVETVAPQACPCTHKAGYSPTISARFLVTGPDGTPLQAAAVRRSDRSRDPWLQVTDTAGCVGITWIVPAGQRTIPLVLEKSGYQPAAVEVPVMEDHCYAVGLSPTDDARPSRTMQVEVAKCQCAMFTGQTMWPKD